MRPQAKSIPPKNCLPIRTTCVLKGMALICPLFLVGRSTTPTATRRYVQQRGIGLILFKYPTLTLEYKQCQRFQKVDGYFRTEVMGETK